MNRNHPSPFATLETSDGFLGPLWRGTMQSLLDRTREDGFCQTSFGEENGVKCYGVCHYSRDAAEAAGVLADQGCPEPAARILDFTLSHIPEGQYFIVHAYRPDGTPLHNKIQIDTPAHPARALARLLETGADDPALPRCFDRLDRVFDDTWRHHFHAAFRLLDSGNYNEQLGGGTEPLLDLFTNGAMYGGCLAMAEAARLLNRPAIVTERYLERAALLDRGIDHWLYDPAADLYRAALRPDGKAEERPLNWINLYPERWYPGRRSAWRRAFEELWRAEHCNDWGGLRVPSGETGFMKLRTMGKVIGQMLRFAARSGDDRRLKVLLEFLRRTVRRPADLYPEYWLHHLPSPGQSPYLDWFFGEFEGVWNGFAEDPAADYTVDSGNCEQCAVFLGCFSGDVLGFSAGGGKVEAAPRLPGTAVAEVRNRALGVHRGRRVAGGFRLDAHELEFTAEAPVEELTLTLPFYAGEAPAPVGCEPPKAEVKLDERGATAVFRNVSSARLTRLKG